jgi:hypothetical protein
VAGAAMMVYFASIGSILELLHFALPYACNPLENHPGARR